MENPALTKSRLLRLDQIIGSKSEPGLIPVCKATWYGWMRSGYAPSPLKLGQRTSVWRVKDLEEFIKKVEAENQGENICH